MSSAKSLLTRGLLALLSVSALGQLDDGAFKPFEMNHRKGGISEADVSFLLLRSWPSSYGLVTRPRQTKRFERSKRVILSPIA